MKTRNLKSKSVARVAAGPKRSLKKMRIPILLLAGMCLVVHADQSTRIGMRTSIEVGPTFEKDPYSAEEGKKWTESGKDPSIGIELWICAYGYIGEMDLLHTIPDFNYEDFRKNPEPPEALVKKNARCKTVGEYFSKMVIPKGATKTRLDWSDRYEHWEKHRVTVWFFKRGLEDDLYGWCYEQMQIDTGETSTEGLNSEIRTLIDSARPWDVPWKTDQEQPTSKQGGADQPATAPESKSPDNQNAKPDAEGRSQ